MGAANRCGSRHGLHAAKVLVADILCVDIGRDEREARPLGTRLKKEYRVLIVQRGSSLV